MIRIYIVLLSIPLLFACGDTKEKTTSVSNEADTIKNISQARTNADPNTPQKNEEHSARITYKYDPEISTITGRLVTAIHYGPPGFGETPKEDVKEEVYILQLESPVDVIASEGSTDEFNVPQSNVTEVQLASPDVKLASFENKEIKVTGTFFGAHTGHHYRDVLMMVEKVEELNK